MQQTITELYKSDFGQFFHIKEHGRQLINDMNLEIHIKTGGFQDFIDILVLTDLEKDTIIECSLLINRDWFDDKPQSIFTLDLIKSFIEQFSINKEYISPLIKYLWRRDDVVLKQKEFID